MKGLRLTVLVQMSTWNQSFEFGYNQFHRMLIDIRQQRRRATKKIDGAHMQLHKKGALLKEVP
jgi:hypothetical protein